MTKNKEMENNKKYEPTDDEKRVCEFAYSKFKEAYVAKAPLMKEWKKYMDAYDGSYYNKTKKVDYKSNQVSNHVFSIVESIRPIMTDNNPKFLAIPRQPDGMDVSADIQTALDYEWDRERMSTKLPSQLIPMLVYGTAIWYIHWDGNSGEYGNIKGTCVDPFNIFPDPLATCVDDAEYIIYATYKNANKLKKQFPKKASAIEGASISMSELVNERDTDSRDSNQVLVIECWCRDWTTVETGEKEDKKKMLKYPTGRVITCLPELGILLSDKKNPYKDGKFPFVLMKDYDIPFRFWGTGEVAQIMSPQHYINELTNQIIDNAKNTANMPWIIDKNSGIGVGKLTNRPGLVIRKNPGTEVRRDAPPPMPGYTREQIEVLKKDMQDISGVFDSLKGERQSGVVAAQAIMALQEASQARIRLKIKIMEQHLSDLASMWYSRMQQFWKLDKWVRVTDIEGNPNFKQITQEVLKNDFDINVQAGSTMPTNKNAMLDLMIRLAQTNAEDGLPVVDRKAILEYLPATDKRAIISRIEQQKAQQKQEQELANQQALEQQHMQQQQVQGEMNESVTQQVTQMLQEVMTQVQSLGNQVDELILDKEDRDKKEYESKIEEKGYKRGVKDGKMQTKEEGREEMPKVSEPTPMEEEMPLDPEVEKLQSQQIPIDVLEGLLQMMESDPQQLMQIMEQYPELQEILQQDLTNMNGGIN